MAVVGGIFDSMPPASAIERANPGVIDNGGEIIPVLRFDDTTQQYYDLLGALEGWQGGNLTVSFVTCTQGTPTTTLTLEAGFRALGAAENIGTSHTFVNQSATVAQAAGVRQLVYTNMTFTAGQIDGLLDEQRFILRVTRPTTDSQLGNLELLWPAIIIRE